MLENKTADYFPEVYVWCCGAAVQLPKHETRPLTAVHVDNVCRYASTFLYVLNSSSSGLWIKADSFYSFLKFCRDVCCYLNGDFRKSQHKRFSF